MQDIITSTIYIFGAIVGTIFLFGFIIRLFEIIIIKLLDYPAYYKLIKSTSFIGTIIHELSHALMCIIFGHKIQEIKLYSPNAADGTFGYVLHTYNKKNIYQRMGNFFIGVSPILLGNMVISILLITFFPNTLSNLNEIVSDYYNSSFSFENLIQFFKEYLTVLGSMLVYIDTIGFWICFIVLISLMFHMQLSRADIKGSISGIVFFLVLILITNIIIGLINKSWLIWLAEHVTYFNIYSLTILFFLVLMYLLLILLILFLKFLKKLV